MLLKCAPIFDIPSNIKIMLLSHQRRANFLLNVKTTEVIHYVVKVHFFVKLVMSFDLEKSHYQILDMDVLWDADTTYQRIWWGYFWDLSVWHSLISILYCQPSKFGAKFITLRAKLKYLVLIFHSLYVCSTQIRMI